MGDPRLVVAAIAMGGLASIAAAQNSADDAGGRSVKALTECRAITADTARLACFDRAAAALAAAVEAKDVAIVDRQEIRRARRSLFGFALPSFSFLGGDDRGGAQDADPAREAEFQEINSTVKSARASGSYGRFDITLDDGAVWQNTETLRVAPRSGAAVRIRRAAMGSYFLRVDGISVRAIRLR